MRRPRRDEKDQKSGKSSFVARFLSRVERRAYFPLRLDSRNSLRSQFYPPGCLPTLPPLSFGVITPLFKALTKPQISPSALKGLIYTFQLSSSYYLFNLLWPLSLFLCCFLLGIPPSDLKIFPGTAIQFYYIYDNWDRSTFLIVDKPLMIKIK